MQTVVFRKEQKDYFRDTKVLNGYVDQASLFLSKKKNISLEAAREFVIKNMKKGGLFEFRDPMVKYLHRENFADRELKETTMSRYLADVYQNNESMSPTFTTYCSPDVRQSLLALYTMDNIVKRSVLKDQMFDAKNAGDTVLYVFKDLGQNNAKTTNNSLSGASLTPSTALFNPTSHSSLTTNCRNTTAYGNANNEKFIEGNRHYMDVDTILNNLVSICAITDLDKVEEAMQKFQLHWPTVQDVIECIDRSRLLYFQSNQHMQPVWDFVEVMKPLERAAFVYVSDFYHLYKHNKVFVTALLNQLSRFIDETMPLEEAKFVLKTVSEDTVNLSRQICRSFSVGKKPKEIMKESEYNYGVLASNAKNINNTLCSIQPVIDAFWLSGNMPASTGNFPYSLRRSVLGGDTDSTLFTVQEWVGRVYGEIGFTDEMESTSDVVVYLAAQTSSHLHAMMSANYGVHPSRYFDVQMKNEYKFKIFCPTSMAKHYFAMKTAQEGNVFRYPDLELKGANMISSATPGTIVKEVKKFLLQSMQDVVDGKGLNMNDIIDMVAEKEWSIYDDVKSGNTDYFRAAHLKKADAYKAKDADRTPYFNHTFWNRTFGKIYGMVDEPPYTSLKVSLEIGNVTDWQTYLDQIQNKDLVKDIEAECARIGRKYMTTIYVPQSIIQISGIPDEILIGSNARKIVRDCCGAYYHILETMGIFMSNKKNTRMIYDTY
uniref:DNA polymerase n=1 Tax=Burkholderia phage vB_BgluM-SURPRISE13 TaxID=3159457 RepID=A0AAU7PFE9_9VIRU